MDGGWGYDTYDIHSSIVNMDFVVSWWKVEVEGRWTMVFIHHSFRFTPPLHISRTADPLMITPHH
jgi:hypothetical protein